MAITLDNSSINNLVSTGPTGTLSYTVNASTNGLLVVIMSTTSNRTPTAVSWGSQNFVTSNKVVGSGEASVWWLVAPIVGTKTLSITTGVSGTNVVTTVVSLLGVNQTTPLDSSTTSSGTGTAASAIVSVINSNAWILDCLFVATPSVSSTLTSSQTTLTNLFASGVGTGGSSYSPNVASGSRTMAWSWTGSQAWAQAAVAFQSASSVTPTISYIPYLPPFFS